MPKEITTLRQEHLILDVLEHFPKPYAGDCDPITRRDLIAQGWLQVDGPALHGEPQPLKIGDDLFCHIALSYAFLGRIVEEAVKLGAVTSTFEPDPKPEYFTRLGAGRYHAFGFSREIAYNGVERSLSVHVAIPDEGGQYAIVLTPAIKSDWYWKCQYPMTDFSRPEEHARIVIGVFTGEYR